MSQTARLQTQVYWDFFASVIGYIQPCQFAVSIFIRPVYNQISYRSHYRYGNCYRTGIPITDHEGPWGM